MFSDMSAECVKGVVNDFKDSFEEDKTMGLVKQVVDSLVRRDIKAYGNWS